VFIFLDEDLGFFLFLLVQKTFEVVCLVWFVR